MAACTFRLTADGGGARAGEVVLDSGAVVCTPAFLACTRRGAPHFMTSERAVAAYTDRAFQVR